MDFSKKIILNKLKILQNKYKIDKYQECHYYILIVSGFLY